MLKLMKYEFRKQALSKVIIVLLLLAFEIMFFLGVIASGKNMIMVSNIILQMIMLITFCYLFMEPIASFHSDLGKKQGYLLFMTPRSNYQIVGAKILMGVIQMAIFFVLFIGLFTLNHAVFSWKNGTVSSSPFEENLNAFNDPGFSFREFIAAEVFLVLLLVCFFTLAFLSISISYSFLIKGKLNKFMSFLIFIVLSVIELLAIGLVISSIFENTNVTNFAFVLVNLTIAMALPASINFFMTGRLLDKKMSL